MRESKYKRVAIVCDSLFSLGGANRVLFEFLDIFPNADIYSLFGNKSFVDEYLSNHKVVFSFLQKFPFISKTYQFLLPIWPIAVESFDLSSYDLVISSSSNVAKGSITAHDSLHISYIHSPMRYLWDLKDIYTKRVSNKNVFFNYLRMWDVSSSSRADFLIANSKFVSDRISRYWGIDGVPVIYPPVDLYMGDIPKKKGDYFVAGAPFAHNKGGEFIIHSAIELGFNLKIIGDSKGRKKLESLSRGFDNIEFLGRVSEEQRWDILKNARGYLAMGVEDFGIFPVEAISCGTPVIAFNSGGYKESVIEGVNGTFINTQSVEELAKAISRIAGITVDRGSVKKFSKERFKKDVEDFVLNSI